MLPWMVCRMCSHAGGWSPRDEISVGSGDWYGLDASWGCSAAYPAPPHVLPSDNNMHMARKKVTQSAEKPR